MLCLLTQPQKELQLDLKANNTQNCQEIGLYGSLTTKDLKTPHSTRWVGPPRDAEMGGEGQRCGGVEGVVPHSHEVDKNQDGYGSKPDSTAQGYITRKINPNNSWL